jgi:nucleotide-binding universal stress UspA family protein
MFETVVVGVDDSPTAAKALGAAIELAKLSGGTLHIVTAYKPASRSSSGVPSEFSGSVQPDSHARSLLDGLSSRARSESVKAETHAQAGDPAEAITTVADRVEADLIVVGSQGMQRRVLGSVPNSIAHGAGCAVLVVKTD